MQEVYYTLYKFHRPQTFWIKCQLIDSRSVLIFPPTLRSETQTADRQSFILSCRLCTVRTWIDSDCRSMGAFILSYWITEIKTEGR